MKKSHKKILIGAGVGIGAVAVISAAIGVTLSTTKKESVPFNLKITSGNSRLNLNFNGTDRATYGLARVKVEFYDKSGKPVADTTVPLRANAFQKGVFVAGLKLDSNTEYTYRVLSTDAVATTLFEGKFTTGEFKKSANRVVQLVEADINSEDITLNSIGIEVFYGPSMKDAKGTIKVTYISSDDQAKIKDNELTTSTTTTDSDSQPSNNPTSNNTSNNITSNNTTSGPVVPTPTVKEFAQDSTDSQTIKLENLERGKNYYIKVDYVPSSSVIQPISLFEGYIKTQDPRFNFLFNEATEEKEQEYFLNIDDVKSLLLDQNNKITLFHKKQDANRWSKFVLDTSNGGQFDIQKEIISGNSTDPFLFYDFKLELEKDGEKQELVPLTQTVLLNPAQFNKFSITLENEKLVNLNNKVLRDMDHDKPTRHNTYAVMFDQLKTRKELDFFNKFLRTTSVFSKKIIDDVFRFMGAAIISYTNKAYNKNTWDLNRNNKGPSDVAEANKKGYWNSKHIWFQHPPVESSNYPLSYILLATNDTQRFLNALDDTSEYTLGGLKMPTTQIVKFRGEDINFGSFWTRSSDERLRSGMLLNALRITWSTESANSIMHDYWKTPDLFIPVLKFAFASRTFEANHSFALDEPTMIEGDSSEEPNVSDNNVATSNNKQSDAPNPPANPHQNQPAGEGSQANPTQQPPASGQGGGTPSQQPPAPAASSSSSTPAANTSASTPTAAGGNTTTSGQAGQSS